MSPSPDKHAQSKAAPPRGWLGRLWAVMQRGGSAGWLLTTAFQGLLTWVFILVARLSAGFPWEHQARQLVLIAIVATWCMALRTIRQRLIELLRSWHAYSRGLIEKAARKAEAATLAPQYAPKALWQTMYVRKSILRLRIIAAGITMPFFVLPLFLAALAVSLYWAHGATNTEWLSLAACCALLATVVAVYFRWSILLAPARVAARRPASTRPRRLL
ncbi:MAG: hypothetical protein M5U26_21895 [Planctomycetota bacterium]|nr:hypothetical protein [Planctomycetota bacterium]